MVASASAAASIDLDLGFLASGGAGVGGRRECCGMVAECLTEDEESELGSASAESHSAASACAAVACATLAGGGARWNGRGEEGRESEREIGEGGREEQMGEDKTIRRLMLTCLTSGRILAGADVDEVHIHCNDEGVAFVSASAHCALKEVMLLD
ncbi:hypothetical protein C2845_PM18G07640 [Panicum miliaceum]|uniref:Uncharacterized protein n=1 Tax=Panicum miliaceum TaxID=4540 RepID=A0A3L6PGD8_PANMI|nr:hypothetical protein C2845_PM18G07640 [Panicum miliaceum]